MLYSAKPHPTPSLARIPSDPSVSGRSYFFRRPLPIVTITSLSSSALLCLAYLLAPSLSSPHSLPSSLSICSYRITTSLISHLLNCSASPTVCRIGYYSLMRRHCGLSCAQYKDRDINIAGKYIQIPPSILSDRFGLHLSCCHGMGRLGGLDESPISSLSPIARARSTPKVHAHRRRRNIGRIRPDTNSSSYLLGFYTTCLLPLAPRLPVAGDRLIDCIGTATEPPQAITRDKATLPSTQPIHIRTFFFFFFLFFQLHICRIQVTNDPQIAVGNTTIFHVAGNNTTLPHCYAQHPAVLPFVGPLA